MYALDRLTKDWAVSNLSLHEPRELLGSVLQLHLVFNPGAAFSVGAGSTWVFTIVQAAVSLAILAIAFWVRSWPWRVGLGLVLGGALGNLTDRLTREPGFGVGHVVDFLELPRWPVFNIADSAIVTGAVVIAIATVLGVPVLSRAQATERADV